MKQFTFILLMLFSSLMYAQPTDKEVVGTWEGKLSVQGTSLSIIFHITQEKGVLSSKMDVPEQGAKDIACEKTEYVKPHLKITIPRIMGKFEGDWSAEKQEFVGKWSQGGQDFELNLHKTDKASATINRPQEPKAPFPYKIEEVSFDNPKGGHKLSGTLTLPKKGKAPFPAVILVSGSGPQDRDETILGHKPFWVIADYLTKNGIAVLRYDDRGVGKSTGDFAKATSADFASDALAAFNFLKKNKKINAKKIGIAGHSEGGLIAPMVAAESNDLGFLILLAGTGVDGGEILLEQAQLIARAEGTSEELISKSTELNKEVYAFLRTDATDESLKIKLENLLTEWFKTISEDEKKALQWTESAEKQMIAQLCTPWMRYFIRYNPATNLEKVKCPVLALNGEKDIQVPSKQNLPAIENALKKAGNTNFKVMEIPNLNHLFQNCQKCSVSEYANLEETFSPEVMKMMKDWILGLK